MLGTQCLVLLSPPLPQQRPTASVLLKPAIPAHDEGHRGMLQRVERGVDIVGQVLLLDVKSVLGRLLCRTLELQRHMFAIWSGSASRADLQVTWVISERSA